MKATTELQVTITVEAEVQDYESLKDIKEDARKKSQEAVSAMCAAHNEANGSKSGVTLRSGVCIVKALRDVE